MKAVVIRGPGRYALCEKEPKPLRPGWARIQTLAAAVCATDLEVFDGRIPAAYPVTPGHEWSGVVREINGEDKSLLNRRVVGSNDVCCLTCSQCRSGNWRNCASFGEIGFQHDGAYAEYFDAPLYALYALPDSVSDIQGALLEPLGVALGTLDKVNARLGDTLLIFGAGSIGLNMLAAAKAAGLRRITVVERSGGRLDIAKAMGAQYAFATSACEIRHELSTVFPEGPDIVIDATGSAECVNLALEIAPKGGRVALAGYFKQQPMTLIPDRIHIKNLRVLGSGNLWNVMGRSLSLVSDGVISTEALCTKIYPLEQFESALNDARTRAPGFVKAVFTF